MKFEVVNKNGQVVMWTDSRDCIPAPDKLKSISNSGYHLRIDNKTVAYNKVYDLIESILSTKSNNSIAKRLF